VPQLGCIINGAAWLISLWNITTLSAVDGAVREEAMELKGTVALTRHEVCGGSRAVFTRRSGW
jgi:hypothetical protein